MDLERLSKAIITNTYTKQRVQVMYNPEEFSLNQGNSFAEVGIPGLDSPPVQYVRGKTRTLSMDLFFDTYEREEDVRSYTGEVVRLLDKLPQTHAPPVLLFTMGRFNFECVLVDAKQKYTMFLRDGTPVRATISVTFQEFTRVEIEVERGLFVGPPTLHNVGQGQTVSNLAADYLGDPAVWRDIAEANDIDDVFRLVPGAALIIPGDRKK